MSRLKLIEKISKFQNESFKKLIIPEINMKIYYKHNHVNSTYINHINNISGNIFGFSIHGHTYYNQKYLSSKRSNTIWNSSEPRSMTFKEIYDRKSIYLPQNVDGGWYYLDINTYFPIKIENPNINIRKSSLYICNQIVCFDPSMQLLDLFGLYIQKKNLKNNKEKKKSLIKTFYDPLPRYGVPLIVKDIKNLYQSDFYK